jgi:hypothetical protein
MELLSWNCSWRETIGVQLVNSSTTCVLVIYNDIVCPHSSLCCKADSFSFAWNYGIGLSEERVVVSWDYAC